MTGNLFPARLRETHIEKHQNMNYRRNGKLQACEPCRKAKLRCDHFMPQCGRCVKMGKGDRCVYHPAPLTKPTVKRSRQLEKTPSEAGEGRSPYQPLSGTGRTPMPAAYLVHLEHTKRLKNFAHLYDQHQSGCDLTASAPPSFEYPQRSQFGRPSNGTSAQQGLEFTHLPSECQVGTEAQQLEHGSSFISHAAVLGEHEPSVGLTPPLFSRSGISQEHIDHGVSLLLLLRNSSSIQKYIDKWFSFAGGVVVIQPMVKIYLDGLWASWHKVLESSRIEDVRRMSAQIWSNTSRPLSQVLHRDTTARGFCTSVTGPDLRWEVVGVIVSLVSLVAQSLKDGDPVFCSIEAAPVDRSALALSMYDASQACVEFCDHLGVLNDLYLWLFYENTIAYCSLRSRGSYDSWRKTSSFMAALQCANLHEEIKVDDGTPFFMAELRKRLFICAYSNDKLTAAFAGRPPKLTRQYCRLQIPLDLTDSQTMSEGPELQNAIAELDDQGWNRDGAVQRSTFARLSATNALITEEILEISLGRLSQEVIASRAVDIEAQALAAWRDLPEFLRIEISDPWSSRRSPLETLFLIQIRLASLDHHFLLQRTLSKKVHPGSISSLLSVCSEIFGIVIQMVDNRDRFRDFQIDFIQMLCTHGLPAASILAAELLHQERDPTSDSAAKFPLHRSDTIQSLSVFVACLGTIKPDANGYQSCDRGRLFLKRILDLILGPGPATPRVEEAEAEKAADPTLGAPLFDAGGEGDFMRWLDDVQWDQETWINFT